MDFGKTRAKIPLASVALAAAMVLGGAGVAAAARCSDFNGDGYSDLAIGVPGDSVTRHEGAGSVQVFYGGSDGLSAAADQLWTQSGRWNGSEFVEDLPGRPDAGDRFGAALARGDFDGDGVCDLAVGVPGQTVSDEPSAGSVAVLFGVRGSRRDGGGLSNRRSQLWTQAGRLAGHEFVDDILGSPEDGDGFGGVLAAGDFDGNGVDDLAIGVSGEDVRPPGETDCDASDGGFPAGGRTGLLCPFPEIEDAGAVQVLYGSRQLRGLQAAHNQIWTQLGRLTARGRFEGNLHARAEAYDHFGLALAAGNFNDDTRGERPIDDLAIGVPYESGDEPDDYAIGVVHVLYGSRERLDAEGNQIFRQGHGHLRNEQEYSDRFGWSLAAGNFDGAGGDDLAVGVIGEQEGQVRIGHNEQWVGERGAVQVLYHSAASGRLSGADDDFWTHSTFGFTVRQADLGFAQTLTAGNFNGDRRGSRPVDDLAIGIPDGWSGPGSLVPVGSVGIVYGSEHGLTSNHVEFFTQGDGARGAAERGNRFGFALATGNFDGDRSDGHDLDDLAIGVPHEDGGVGAVNVLRGSAAGIVRGGSVWMRSSDGVIGAGHHGDEFGRALAGR